MKTSVLACTIGLPIHAHVMFRPQDVRIVAEDMTPDQPDHLYGQMEAAFFLGDHTRLMLDTGSPTQIAVGTID